MDIERRTFFTKETRAEGEGDERRIVGTGAKFNAVSPDYGGFREIIEPGFFRAALASSEPIFVLFNHESNFILGERNAGTAEITESAAALPYSADYAKNDRNQDYVIGPLDRGELTGSSFGFSLKKRGEGYELEEDPETGGVLQRLLPDGAARLYDVGPVTFPFYNQTEATARQIRSFIDDRKIRFIPENHITHALRKQRARSLFMR